ncbi:MAG: hypothetical protein V1789_03705 [PVC group bacterium]
MKNVFRSSVVIVCCLFLGMIVIPEAFPGGEFKPDKKRSEAEANLSGQIEPAEVKTVAEAIDIAESYFKEAHTTPDTDRQKILFFRGDEYFKRAHEILNKEKSELLLKEGWLKLRWSLGLNEALPMLEEGLQLSPDNPVAYYKVAFLKRDKYSFSLPKYTDKPQRTKKMPDGTVVHLEPVHSIYSEENDNTLLEEAQKLAEKAVQLDPTFANAYEFLSSLHGFKRELEKANHYKYLFLMNKEYFNLELLYYNENLLKYNWIPSAISLLRSRAPEKYEELVKQNIIGPDDEEFRTDVNRPETSLKVK